MTGKYTSAPGIFMYLDLLIIWEGILKLFSKPLEQNIPSGNGGSGGSSPSFNGWVDAESNPHSIRLSHCVLGQETSPALPADGGQWCRLYGRPTSVSAPGHLWLQCSLPLLVCEVLL
ncbi:hypothetical protein ATANTOWER_007889 [Ataeniobius toweri]|uniref:Uncharacterized protein n=1 Tax=Ataeniobius toweri TaxID=208326 RepID=A0ABU7BDA8_9TELE|nr:hypothetical protein [Ataeniobius toweri]